MRAIEQIYHINAPVSQVWQALVDPKLIDAWGGGPAKMNEQKDFNFSLWDGEIYGKNTNLIKEKLLEQDWYEKDDKIKTHVVFNLVEKDGETIVTLTHTDFPEDKYDDLSDGWKKFYLGPLKEYLESN